MEDVSEKIVKVFREKFSDERTDFEKFWYKGERFQYRPFVGYSHVPFSSKTLNLNKNGFRGADFKPRRMNTNVKRIGFFGASAMLGIPNTSDNNTIPELVKNECAKQNLQVEVFNFGLMCGTIKHELNLALQIVSEYDFDMIFLFSGFNDVYLAYSGNVWNAYEDIDQLFTQAFLNNKERNNPLFFGNLMFKSFRRKWNDFVKKKMKIDWEKALQFKARQQTATREVHHAYEQNCAVYLECLHQFIQLAKYAKLPVVFSHQPSVYATAKNKSEYEQAMVDVAMDFGVDRGRSKQYAQQFGHEYSKQRNAANDLAKNIGATVIDTEESIARLNGSDDIFYDYCHLLPIGNQTVSREFSKHIINHFNTRT